MTVYSIFLVQIFLGIVVGHFEVEWKRVEAIHNSNKDQSYNVIAIMFRIMKTHFTNEARKLQLLEEGNTKEEKEDDEPKKCTCPCSLSSFNPSGMFERIVLYCMMRVCKKKKEKEEPNPNDEDGSEEEGSDEGGNENAFTATQESKSTKASAGGVDPN